MGLAGRPVHSFVGDDGRYFTIDAGKTLAYQTNDVNVVVGRMFVNGGVVVEAQHRHTEMVQLDKPFGFNAATAFFR